MKAPERILVWLLRVSGAVTLMALGAVVLPYEWMNVIHQHIGMGELPHIPIVGYLTRCAPVMSSGWIRLKESSAPPARSSSPPIK